MYKYFLIVNAIEQQLEQGHIRAGQKLPSIRDLSHSFACTKSTVIRALTILESRHLIYSIPQSGYYAVQQRAGAIDASENRIFDFSSAAPDPDLFPYLDFKHCVDKAFDMYKNELFAYGTPQGLPSLLKLLSKHLANYQVFTKSDHIHVTSGVQQALSILSLMPFPNQKRGILIEQPSYHLFIQLIASYQIPVHGIARSVEGIDLDELEHLFRTEDIKFFYTMPRFHNPLGCSYSESTKKAIAKLAKRNDVYIVEDDYLADLEQDSKSDPIYAYDSSHVIYLKSYAKILFPGLRVGVAVLPPDLDDTFRTFKKVSDIDSPMLSQAALEIYIQSGMFERRQRKIRDAYSERLVHLHNSLTANSNGSFTVSTPLLSGVHTHIELPAHMPIPLLLERLRKKQVLIQNLAPYYLPGFDQMALLSLSITRVADERIDAGVQIIAHEIKHMIGQMKLGRNR
ncbi:GntR family transcriptional regulator [Paenibacillus pectinilyticus]|uniref:GntR family transcriptional regulator n=1 Tax=Paenibacillus pectinilyticus TaxID=512399 RepID=A0A1C0ZY56_9BACL|nr:PLP-dependent aminotransferase family protein [Paenibacillus pectinilyticus]OCT13018.1 GntR family transcriptional regulator [Paenibacillus pectinilyticus]